MIKYGKKCQKFDFTYIKKIKCEMERLQRIFPNSDHNTLVVLFGIAVFIYSMTNLAFIKANRILDEISATVITIDGDHYNQSYNDQLVYFQTNNTKYLPIYDRDFNLNVYGARLKRTTQYCQWDEMRIAETEEINNVTYTNYRYVYFKKWSLYHIPSLLFHNPLYNNPNVDMIPNMEYSSQFYAGDYVVDEGIPTNGRDLVVSFDNQDILDFEESELSKTFQYYGRGIFYREYKKGTLGKIISTITFFDTENYDRIEWCTPGDTRTFFRVWAPDSVSVLGKKVNNTIKPVLINNFNIGSVQPGIASISDLVNDSLPTFTLFMFLILNLGCIVFIFYDLYKNGFSLYFALTYLSLIMATIQLAQFNEGTFELILLSLLITISAEIINHMIETRYHFDKPIKSQKTYQNNSSYANKQNSKQASVQSSSVSSSYSSRQVSPIVPIIH